MRKFIIMMLTLFMCINVQAQENQYLRDLTEAVKGLRKSDSKVHDQFIDILSARNKPKITLMDDIKSDGDEYEGEKANRFHLNQAIVYVYGKQNPSLTSKNDGMLSSKERGIYYSAIEKSIMKNGTVRYCLNGHIGLQEFSVIAYRSTAKFKLTIADEWHKPVTKEAVGNVSIEYFNVSSNNTIVITIEYIGDEKNKESFESFAILNFNPQKK